MADKPARRRRLRPAALRLLRRLHSRLARALPGTALGRLIRRPALQAWPLLAALLLSSLLLAFCEGLTFMVIFQAARLLSGGESRAAMALPGSLGMHLSSLGALSAGQRFALLLGIAVMLQGLTSLCQYINGVSAGWFAARCQRQVTHSPSEARILEAVDRFARGRTVLTAAHRLSSVQYADLIMVFEAGRIVERGQHEELLSRGGRYAELWDRQARRSEPARTMPNPTGCP